MIRKRFQEFKPFPWVAVASFMLLIAVSLASVAGAATLGAPVIATGEPIEVRILPASALLVSDIYLTPLSATPERRYLGDNTETHKWIPIEAAPKGEELLIEIVPRCGTTVCPTYATGPAFRNPDGLAHAIVSKTSSTRTLVSFEDTFGGGDGDFNDTVLEVHMRTLFSGLDLWRLGGADLGTAEDGSLVLSHLSDSGGDGMAVSLGGATGWDLDLKSLVPSLPTQTLTVTARGTIGGVSDTTLATARAEVSEDGILSLAASFSPFGSSSVRFDLVDPTESVVRTLRYVPNGNPFDPCPLSTSPKPPQPARLMSPDWGFEQKVADFCCWPVPGDLPWDPDKVVCVFIEYFRATPEAPIRTPELLSEALLTTNGVSSVTFGEAAVQFEPGGLLHRGLGHATLEAAGGSLTVAHLGASGEDGVAVESDPAVSFSVAAIPPPPRQLPEGAFIDFVVRGIGLLGEQEFGRLRLNVSDGAVEIVEGPGRILVLDDGEIVADVVEPFGIQALVGKWPVEMSKGQLRLDGQTVWGYGLRFDGDEPVWIPPGGVVFGDSLWILTGGVPIESVTELRLQAKDIPAITLLGEGVVPANLFADGFESGDLSRWSNVVGNNP